MDTSPITFNRTEILYECIMCTHSVCTPVPHSSMLRLPVTSFVAFFCPYVILYFSFIVCYRVFDQSICCSLSLSTCCNTSTKTMFKTFFFCIKETTTKNRVFFQKVHSCIQFCSISLFVGLSIACHFGYTVAHHKPVVQ